MVRAAAEQKDQPVVIEHARRMLAEMRIRQEQHGLQRALIQGRFERDLAVVNGRDRAQAALHHARADGQRRD